MNLTSNVQICLHFVGENEACSHEPRFRSAHRHTHIQKWKHNIRQFHSIHLADIISSNFLKSIQRKWLTRKSFGRLQVHQFSVDSRSGWLPNVPRYH